jgi:hypothetical protein
LTDAVVTVTFPETDPGYCNVRGLNASSKHPVHTAAGLIDGAEGAAAADPDIAALDPNVLVDIKTDDDDAG